MHALVVVRCCQAARPGVYLDTSGLLQLVDVWHQRQPQQTPTSRSKRRGAPHHQREKMRAHHARPAAAALAAGPTMCAFQARRADIGLQGTTRSAAVLPGGALPTCYCHWTLPTAFVGLRHVPSSANRHKVRRSLVCHCGATNMEQSANPIAGLRTNTLTIQADTKDTLFRAYIRPLTAAAPSDSVFVRWAQIDLLTYLLTYRDL